MFDKKRQLTPPPETKSDSLFVNEALKPSPVTKSGNNALKYSTSGNAFVDQFSFIGSYKAQRSFKDVSKDCEELFRANAKDAVKFIFYLRTISRSTALSNGKQTEKPQIGAELRHEVFFRLFWLNENHPDIFYKNIAILPIIGSWKDIFQLLKYDLSYNGWAGRRLDWDKIGNLLLAGLDNPKQRELIKKYMPHIRAKSACKTIDADSNSTIGKWLCNLLFGSNQYFKYRKLKSSGTQHEWQQLISTKQFDKIDFNKIHGRALSILVRSKFLKNHGLQEKYNEWIKSPDTKNVKYTGFVHELLSPLDNSPYFDRSSLTSAEKETINKQFETLVNKCKSNSEQSKLIVVRDTSVSMEAPAIGTNSSANHIAKSIALYFSEFLEGRFANAWIEFNTSAQMHTWSGSNVCEKYLNDNSTYIGSTNFMSVIRLFCGLKQHNNVPESEFPEGILCISDGEFNSAQLGVTNVTTARSELRAAGFSDQYCNDFKIILWNLQSRYYGFNTGKKFETYGNVSNTYYFSGYSASVISFLTSKIENAEQLVKNALDQEVLNLIEL